jgi:hypothetical protein
MKKSNLYSPGLLASRAAVPLTGAKDRAVPLLFPSSGMILPHDGSRLSFPQVTHSAAFNPICTLFLASLRI